MPKNKAIGIVAPPEGPTIPKASAKTAKATVKATKAAAKALKKSSSIPHPQKALPQRHSNFGAASSTDNTLNTPRHDSAGASSITSPSQQGNQGYDVYAAPFVPSEWRTVNLEEPVCIIPTRNLHKFDHIAYNLCLLQKKANTPQI
jgi:hypothetical protein